MESWSNRQVRPYPAEQDGPRTNDIFVGQGFFGFKGLQDQDDDPSALEFGEFLPDDAIRAVTLWQQAHGKNLQGQASRTLQQCLL